MYQTWSREIKKQFEKEVFSSVSKKPITSKNALQVTLEKDFIIKTIRLSSNDYKKPLFSPNYEEKLITAFLPKTAYLDPLEVDIEAKELFSRLQKGLMWTSICTLLSIFLSALIILLTAKTIISPIQKLKNTALAIASGNYGQKIFVKGPKELRELSTTLNTMSECLYENINRLKEKKWLQDERFSENQSAVQLQKFLLETRAYTSKSDAISIKTLSIVSSKPKGLLLDFLNESTSSSHILLMEAKEKGLESMYDLFRNYKQFPENFSYLNIQIDHKNRKAFYKAKNFPNPFCWSFKKQSFIKVKKQTLIAECGDFLFFYNLGIFHLYQSEENVQKQVQKVWRLFAEDGLSVLQNMLRKEIDFFAKKKGYTEDLHFVFLQIL